MRRVPFHAACPILMLLTIAAAASAQIPSAAGLPAAPPDTLTAVLSGPDGTPAPRLALALPDTLRFGDPVGLTLSFPGGQAPAPDSLRVSVPWLHVAAAPQAGASDGDLVLTLRCWRAGPWRLAWADASRAGEVLLTEGRLPADAAPQPVRDPWRPSRDLRLLGLLAFLLGLLLMVLWRLWSGRGAGLRARASDPAPPAWAVFATALAPAVAEGEPRSGGTSAYLDRLGRATRAYLARRYGVAAGGLTGDDVAPAVAERQYDARRVAAFADLLAACDRLRFAPEPPAAAICRRLTAQAVGAVDADRDGAAGADAAAAAAWVRLQDACTAWSGEEAARA